MGCLPTENYFFPFLEKSNKYDQFVVTFFTY